MSYKVLGVSSGIGVSLYPFKKHVIGNVEPRAIFHTPKEEQWKDNFPDVPLYRNIEDMGEVKNLDVLISSPDCGSGSILRYSRAKKLGDHKKNASLMTFFVGVRKYNPKFFYFENLPALFKSFPKERFVDLCRNYRLVELEAPVSMWGNSQIYRKRLIIIGIRWDISETINYKKLFKLPDLRHLNKTCYELYGDLDEWDATPGDDKKNWLKAILSLGHARENGLDSISIYSQRKMLIRDIRRYWKTELKGKRRWAVTDRKFTTAPGVYRNRRNDYPATARKANRQFDHKGNMLTPRQLARIQGVPDEFKIHVRPDKLKYWINKGRAAVTKTPPMEISIWFKTQIDKILKP